MRDPIDYDYKHNSFTGECIADIAHGVENDYFTGKNKGVYIPRSKLNDNYLVESERYEIEKDLKEQEQSLLSDLKEESSNYKTRLYLDSMAESVELDLNSTNIVHKYSLWDGTKIGIINVETDRNFSLYDIYIKITCKHDFTRKDLLALKDLRFGLQIGGSTIFYRDFFSIVLLELIDDQDILIEPNVIYLKVFTFENMLYGIPNKFLLYHRVKIIIENLPKYNYWKYSEYSIDAIYSGKNIYSSDIKSEYLKNVCIEQVIIQTQETGTELMHFGKKIRLAYNHPVQMLMFFPYDPDYKEFNELDELNRIEIDSVGLFLNKHPIWFEKEELVHVHFMGLDLCILCIDEQLRDIKKFKKYFNNKLDLDTMKSINLSRMDDVEIILECEPGIKNYETDKPYHLFMTGLYTNVFRMMSGMAGLAFCP